MGVRVETLVSDEHQDGHFHDASEHGLAWASLNELLHVIVFVFTLYGMVQFNVKFIRMIWLVKWASRLIIAHSFYLTIKFALLAALTYAYNVQLELQGVEMVQFNCSLSNFERLMQRAANATRLKAAAGQPLETSAAAAANAANKTSLSSYLPLMNALLERHGGPFKLLGTLATLMYGFYAIAIFIMLAIFPLELMYFIDVGFNYIRFVLSDPGCMKDLYERRAKHLARLSSWSRNQTSSLLTQSAKMILNQRALRSHCEHPPEVGGGGGRAGEEQWPCGERKKVRPELAQAPEADGVANRIKRTKWSLLGLLRVRPLGRASNAARQLPLEHAASLAASRQFYNYFDPMAAPPQPEQQPRQQRTRASAVKQLRSRLAINHHDRPSYAVCIANKNLERFKPFVRSDVWFKASMIIYPIFIFFYFILLVFYIGFVEYFFETTLDNIVQACLRQRAAAAMNDGSRDESGAPAVPGGWPEWSSADWLLHYENLYTIFILSCASSFYCSYYFGTILELSIWMREIKQQIELCVHIILLDDILSHPSEFNGLQMLRLMRHQHFHQQPRMRAARAPAAPSGLMLEVDKHVNDFGGFNLLNSAPLDKLRRSLATVRRLTSALVRLKRNSRLELTSQQQRACAPIARVKTTGHLGAKLRELMALKLLSKRETVMRATYVNMCLFFDELNETRFMNTTILRRTTQIASGFAFMASITRSQFVANDLTYLLLITLLVLNFYLACAAYINSNVNKMLIQIHSLISASLKSGCENADLFEFWLRHVSSFGEDEDANAYTIYGYKITWSTILNIDSAIFTLYFMTT